MKQEKGGEEESLTFTKTQAYLILGSIVAIAVLSFSLGHLISSTSNLGDKEVVENIDDEELAGEPDDSLDELDAELNEINTLTTNNEEAGEEGQEIVMLDESSTTAPAEKKPAEIKPPPLPVTEAVNEEKVIVNANGAIITKSFTRRAKSSLRHLPKNIHPRKKIIHVAAVAIPVAARKEKLSDLKVAPPILPPAVPKGNLKSEAVKAKKKFGKRNRAKSSSIPANSRFTVQVKTFPTPDDANQLRDSLKKKGYASYIQKVMRGRSNFYRVRVGGFGNRTAADDAARDIREAEGLTGARADKYTKP